MTNRREFIAASAAILAAQGLTTTANTAVAAPLAKPAARVLPYKFIFDERFEDARALAQHASLYGGDTVGVAGDVTDLWGQDLQERWRRTPAPIAGITTAGSLFCLEHFARNHWMRIIFRAEHNYLGAGLVEHRIVGSPSQLRQAEQDSRADWTSQFADMVTNCSARTNAVQATLVAPTNRFAANQDTLVSWIIAR